MHSTINPAEVLAGLYEKQVSLIVFIMTTERNTCLGGVSSRKFGRSAPPPRTFRLHLGVGGRLESNADLLLNRPLLASVIQSIVANQSEENLPHAQRAQHALDSYSFPVQSMIQRVDGTVIGKLNANDLLNMDSTSEQFLDM